MSNCSSVHKLKILGESGVKEGTLLEEGDEWEGADIHSRCGIRWENLSGPAVASNLFGHFDSDWILIAC